MYTWKNLLPAAEMVMTRRMPSLSLIFSSAATYCCTSGPTRPFNSATAACAASDVPAGMMPPYLQQPHRILTCRTSCTTRTISCWASESEHMCSSSVHVRGCLKVESRVAEVQSHSSSIKEVAGRRPLPGDGE